MIFFSYSRDDSEFVVNLSKELKARGADVWLDQLDIKPGTRWDKSIEDALDASKTVLVALSNTSVASNNVMDEVSYALEEGKTVIPVLLEECDVPFRLRRLQFADFSKSYDGGMQDLASALELEEKSEPKAKIETEEPAVNEPVQMVNEPPKTVEKSTARGDRTEPAPKKSKSKFILYAIIGVAVIIGAMTVGGVFTKDPDAVNSRKKLEVKEATTTPVKVESKPDLNNIKEEFQAIAKRIRFETSRARISGGEKELARLVELLNKYPELKIEIGGHTDSVGAAQNNLMLSQKRADAIKNALVSQGIQANRIVSKGYGETKPIASNNTSVGRAQNSRIEILISK